MSPVQNFEQHSRHLVEPDLSKSIPLTVEITKFCFSFLFRSNFGGAQIDYRNVEFILSCFVALRVKLMLSLEL